MRRVRVLAAIAVVLVIAGCASTSAPPPTQPPSVNVTGKWLGNWMYQPVSLGGGQVVLDMNQVGADVTANVTVTGGSVNRPTTFEAVVSGNQLILRGRFSGTLTVNGDQMSGTVDGVFPATVTAQRQK